MPAVGPSIDRRTFKFVHEVYNNESIYSLICFVCAQRKVHTGLRSTDGSRELSEIRYDRGILGKVF